MEILLPAAISSLVLNGLSEAGLNNVCGNTMPRQGLSIKLNINALGVAGLNLIYDICKSQDNKADYRGLMMEITSLIKIIEAPFSVNVSTLKALPSGIIAFLQQDYINGWLYQKIPDQTYMPWLVSSIVFREGGRDDPASVTIGLIANVPTRHDGQSRNNEISKTKIIIYRDDIVKTTIPHILAKYGFYHESPELNDQYKIDKANLLNYIQMSGEQFIGNNFGIAADDSYRKTAQQLQNVKLINDEEMVCRVINEYADNAFWGNLNLSGFDKIPYHCKLLFFNLDLHGYVWVHASNVQPYEYKKDLHNKLILPETHRDLIEILATDMDVVMDDIIEGKSGGTTILCQGQPGLGKTLTSEVYAEVIQRPLYRVHSGQLGVTGVDVERKLQIILERAQRWRAVLLIDEADVFVRRRDNDIEHNAVVAAFLRKLEYFTGLLFLTTNRADDIDDAILSRCIAVVKFDYPNPEDTAKIWRVLADQFGLTMSDKLIDDLVHFFDKVSGRDIKELLKLTSKFARKKEQPLSVELFRQCAMFRGLNMKSIN